MSIDEERLLFSELNGHLASMALFKTNTGLREQEVVNLSWQWEVQVPELDSSIFVVPHRFVKNGLDRYVALNRIARSVIESCRCKHPERVFTGNGRPVTKIYNSSWKGARRRASERYAEELGRPRPKGSQSLRVHDLKHTWASWQVQAESPLSHFQEFGGWASFSMVQRYAHLSAGHLKRYADRTLLGDPRALSKDFRPDGLGCVIGHCGNN